MNELKRELVKVAGDLSDSEKRVKEVVSRHLHKKKRRWMPAVSIVAACFMLLLFAQFQTKDTAATLSQAEYAYYLHYESAMFDYEMTDFDKTRALDKLLERVGVTEYGKSLGLSVSQEAIDARLEQNKQFTEQTEYKQMMEKVFKEANISQKIYDEQILPRQTESALMGELIVQRLYEQYEQLNNAMARHMMNHYAVEYMEAHYEEEITAFRTQYQIGEQHHSPTAVTGVVSLVEGNMFYLIEDAIWSDIQHMTRAEMIAMYAQNEKAAWYPNVDGLKVAPGDLVRVRSGVSTTENGHSVGMNYGGVEILQSAANPTAKIHLTGQQAQQFTEHIKSVEWEEAKVSMIRLPDHVVTADGVTYSIWAKYKNSGMEIVRHDPNGYVSLPKSPAAPLFELLQ